MKYDNKEQLIQECKDVIALNLNGRTCSPRHVKVLCREIIKENEWKISRIEKDKSIDILPSTR